MTNRERLRDLLIDVFILDPSEFRFDLKRGDVDSWDSLGSVSLAVGLQETFGHHLSPSEVTGLTGVSDIIELLEKKGIEFGDG